MARTKSIEVNLKTKAWAPYPFWKWISLFLAPYGIGHAVLVFLVGSALGFAAGSLLLPYLLLLGCGCVAGASIYWARQSYGEPKSGARRFALAIFFFLGLYLTTLTFSALNLHLLSREAAIYDYGPYILPVATLSSIAVYFTARRSLEAVEKSGSGIGA
jgi:hypothetical protein